MTRPRNGRHRSSHRKSEPSKASPARLRALETVRLWRERDGFVQDIMERSVDASPLSPEDRAFATKLVCGTVSCVGTLNEAIDACLDSPDDVRPNVRDALLISAYEILFLEKSAHAAVDQGVELVRSVAPRAAGLANAVLRRMVRLKEDFPFGDPSVDLAAFARSQGFPLWLAEKLRDDLGREAARAFMEASNGPAPLFVAANDLVTTDEDLRAYLEDAGVGPEPVAVEGDVIAGCFRLKERRALLDDAVKQALDAGKLLVADAASQAVALAVAGCACGRGERCEGFSLLEVGAGRATKTILIQSDIARICGKACVEHVTVDNVEFKAELLRERAQAHGAKVSEVLTGDATDLASVLGARHFDVVFIDAPCTGLGTLRRHPEIRWRIRPESIAEAATLDLALLRSAAAHIAPGGILAYATCTVTPEENEAVIARFLATEEGHGFEQRTARRTHLTLDPTSPDAHFLCIMAKRDR